MKFIRFIFSCLVVVVVLAAILVGAAFVPTVQTWVAQWALEHQDKIQVSVDSVSAGFHHIEATGIHAESHGMTLTVPTAEVDLPVIASARARNAHLQTLVAKGWTLDLSHSTPIARGVPGPGVNPAEFVGGVLIGALKGPSFPYDITIDTADLEGDILFMGKNGAPLKLHLTLKGGGFAPGHEGTLSGDGTIFVLNKDFSSSTYSGHGSVVVSIDGKRSIERLEFKGDVAIQGGAFPQKRTFSGDISAARDGSAVAYALDLLDGDRHLASLSVRDPGPGKRLAGAWKVDAKDSDITPFVSDLTLPSGDAIGNGRFDADRAMKDVHVTGSLTANASHWGSVAAPLEALGALKVMLGVDAVVGATTAHFERLSIAIAGKSPIAAAEALQPFAYDWKQENLSLSDAASDWMSLSIRALPFSWLEGYTGGYSLKGGDLAGEFKVRDDKTGLTFTGTAPVAATQLVVTKGSDVLARGLDLSFTPSATYAPGEWKFRMDGLTIVSTGRTLATGEVQWSKSGGDDQPIAVTGKWKADLAAFAESKVISLPTVAGQTASGDFSMSIGYPTVFDGKLVVAGHDPSHTLDGYLHYKDSGDGRIAFSAPIKLSQGKQVSDVSVDGTTSLDPLAPEISIQMRGDNATLEAIAPVAAALGALGGSPVSTLGAGRDPIPFWGHWTGNATITFERFHAGGQDYRDVGGAVAIEHGALRIERGRFALMTKDKPIAPEFSGTLTFDPAADFPYSLQCTASVDKIEVAPFFGKMKDGQFPPIEGRFTVAGSISGKGINALDLAHRTQESLKVSSTSAIIRMLGTNVDKQITVDEKTSASDVAKSVGSSIGGFFGVSKNDHILGTNHLSKNMEAVLNFNNQIAEIGCDQLSFVLTRDFDGTVHVSDIDLQAQGLRLSGSGQIAADNGDRFVSRPLSLDLTLSVKGDFADLMTQARLLSTQKGKDGFTALNEPVRLGGTLENVDTSQWTQTLVKAATWKPQPAK